MESDTFFYQLFKLLPDTLSALLGQPHARLADYQFQAPEVKKKSYRLDGLFVPNRADLPLYFLEVQFQKSRKFYANLFAKVFSYLEAHDPGQDWIAVAIFSKRSVEPDQLTPYRTLLASPQVRRIYLDEFSFAGIASPGLKMLQLAACPDDEAENLVSQLKQQSQQEPDCERGDIILQLTEELLIRRFHQLNREEIRRMFKLHDIRKTRVWQEAVEEGVEKGRFLRDKQLVAHLLKDGHLPKEIAQLLGISLAEVRRLAKK